MHIISKKKTAVHENSFANPVFRISQSNDKKGNPKNPELDFLIEIHPEDGFLGGEIRFRISRSIGKSRFRFWKSKSGFLNRTHPKYTAFILTDFVHFFSLFFLYIADFE